MVEISNKDINILSSLFEKYYGFPPQEVIPLEGAGSNRKYFRLRANIGDQEYKQISCVGVVGDDLRECRAFINLDRAFDSAGVRVPHFYISSEDMMHYLIQDLGDTLLISIINRCKRASSSEDEYDVSSELRQYVADTLEGLAKLQTLNTEQWERFSEYPAFSERQVKWDLNYFKYEFLKPSGEVFDEWALEDDFESLSDDLVNNSGKLGFMYRDCQSRNIMIYDSNPYFIDFQGGRKGPIIYDAISFLWQARANFSTDFRNEMLEFYFKQFPDGTFGSNKEDRERKVNLFILFRTIQVLGAYGFRGLVEKKASFIESIPSGLNNLREVIDTGIADGYPELKRVCTSLCNNERFKKVKSDALHIKVFSFSYKKGYPEDLTGNGGGFMFDCRGMHNPGRYAEFKHLTGRDAEVINFLEGRGEVFGFVDSALNMVGPSVETYLRRGFTDLQVGFGCTGGRHRSVYCAERFARKLALKYPEAKVELIHREQSIREIL